MPVPIGNQQTISAPHMHATALELLVENLQPGCNVLDVGSGVRGDIPPPHCSVCAARTRKCRQVSGWVMHTAYCSHMHFSALCILIVQCRSILYMQSYMYGQHRSAFECFAHTWAASMRSYRAAKASEPGMLHGCCCGSPSYHGWLNPAGLKRCMVCLHPSSSTRRKAPAQAGQPDTRLLMTFRFM